MTSTRTGKEAAIAAAVEALRNAMIAADKTALDKLAAAELGYRIKGQSKGPGSDSRNLSENGAGFTFPK